MDVLLTPSRIRRLFLRTIDAMEKHPDDFVLHPGRDFTRHRRLPLKDLILLMMSMETSSIGGEIHRFFSLRYPKQPLASRPSPSAFIHQRAKLNDHFFLTLLNRFNERFPLSKTKFGLHLLACDGTDLNIPADEELGCWFSINPKMCFTETGKKSSSVFHLIGYSRRRMLHLYKSIELLICHGIR